MKKGLAAVSPTHGGDYNSLPSEDARAEQMLEDVEHKMEKGLAIVSTTSRKSGPLPSEDAGAEEMSQKVELPRLLGELKAAPEGDKTTDENALLAQEKVEMEEMDSLDGAAFAAKEEKKWAAWMERFVPALYIFSVVSGIVGACYGDCSHGTPSFLFVIMLVLMVASFIAQVYSFHPFVKKRSPPRCLASCFSEQSATWALILLIVEIAIGLLEMMDFLTDGQQVAQAYLCDADFHDRWIASIRESLLPSFVATVLDKMHLWLVMATSIAVAAIASATFIKVLTSPGRIRAEIHSGVAGIGGYGYVFGEKDMVHRIQIGEYDTPYSGLSIKTLWRIPTIILFEILPGLYLQTTLFSLTFGQTTQVSKQKQLLSLAFGAAGLMKLLFEVRCFIPEIIKLEPLSLVMGVPMLATLVTVVVCAARVYYTYMCPSHVWNLTTGCVVF